uniref:BHLH domain-containing protein n=1 Tax=Aegilops tauschii subsp. strangulata TaxID=200361 RepID=A0A453CVQ4_AEGTS
PPPASSLLPSSTPAATRPPKKSSQQQVRSAWPRRARRPPSRAHRRTLHLRLSGGATCIPIPLPLLGRRRPPQRPRRSGPRSLNTGHPPPAPTTTCPPPTPPCRPPSPRPLPTTPASAWTTPQPPLRPCRATSGTKSSCEGTGGEVARSMQVVHDAHNDDSENFLELLNSRTLATELFAEPPACDYLKKMEYGGGSAWPDVHQFSAANMDKHLPSASGPGYWSIAPPNPCHGDSGHHQRVGGSGPCDNAAAMGHVAKALFLDADGNVKHEMGGGGHGAILQEAASTSSTSSQDFTRPIGLGYSSMQGLISNRMYGGGAGAYDVAMDVRWGRNDGRDPRSLSGLISFGRGMGKPAPSGSPAKTSSAEYKKQGREMSSPVPEKTSTSGGCGKGSSALSTKGKKRSEEERGSEGNVKKSKHESCSPTSSSPKGQVTKVKLGHKITALQQMVSPFGKTDTASVLYEAINYIKWLHEQVQVI